MSKIQTEATDLIPATPYTLRIAAVDGEGVEGPPSPEMIVDTEAVGCTPQKKSCCVVQ